MNTLQEELERAGKLLCAVLDSYLDSCHSIQKYYQHANNAGGGLQTLSASIASQFSLIDTLYKTKMKEARSILGQAVNSSSVVVSINSLPPEILVRIFHLVVGGRPCDVKQNVDEKTKFPKYPDFLSRVCTRWRRITLGSPTLWSHIDFVLFSTWSPGLEARAKACATRAGNSLLDIHVYEPAFHEGYDADNIVDFIIAVAPRIRSLEYVIPHSSTWFEETVIDCCFNNCVPGTFTELTILNYGSPAETFIRSAEDSDNADGLELSVQPEVLANLLLPATVLRLHSVFLPWTHGAYHGLVELRLDSTFSPSVHVSELEIVNVLSFSPRLRVLCFGLVVARTRSNGSSITPVRLDDLEMLSLTSRKNPPPGRFLQLISPGPKPLRLTLKFSPIIEAALLLRDDRLRDFIMRSNVTDLHVLGVRDSTYRSISELINPMPNPRILAMSYILPDSDAHPTPNAVEDIGPPARSQLDTLYLIHNQVQLDDLQRFLRQHPVTKLVFWNCSIMEGGRSQSNQELQAKFSAVCPVVRCIGYEDPNPIMYWD